MFFNALGYIGLVIFSGIALLTCFVLFVVRVSQDHKHKWNWLAAVIVSLIVLLFSIYLFTLKVVNTVKHIGQTVENKIEESMDQISKLDSSYKYVMLDSCETVIKLKEFEHINGISSAPKEFYVYYGFNDYYRMPLTYPFSIHCTNVLETGTLFDEKNVVDFNVNDNGEIDCGLDNIEAFAFDNNVLISKIRNTSGKTKVIYYVYEFSTKKKTECNLEKEAFKVARKQFNYRGYDTLITVFNYNHLFN